MHNKKFIISLIIVLVGIGALIFYRMRLNTGNKNYADFLHSQFKTYCRITEKAPFEDFELGIRFNFGNDTLVCDYQSPIQEDGREIYLWKKQAFEKSEPLGQGAVGKLSVNPLPGLPELPQSGVLIKDETSTIAGISTSVKVIRQAECKSDLCFTTRIAELTYLRNRLVLEEYSDDVGLLKSFEFIKTTEVK